MDTGKILSELRAERERLNEAISAIEALDRGTGVAHASRRTATAASTRAPQVRAKRTRKPMSAAVRKRLSELAKQRWAERRKKAGRAA